VEPVSCEANVGPEEGIQPLTLGGGEYGVVVRRDNLIAAVVWAVPPNDGVEGLLLVAHGGEPKRKFRTKLDATLA
jgi:hypothetical protein